ncbi:uncharacterized protein B0T23DRAFT_197824 [Neurospora hispaniola]|uniref:Uncharacterized protein n=1 Tax=Neurospora hispaniola TaxID=588809 RepID=A0AAJ0I3X5_9PEZI|nr:hypothetical protein B0T23DRAFT_197824 [Neurospora hispaniola]
MSSQDTRSMSQRLRPRRPSTFLTLAPIISVAEQKPKVASADEAALESPTESVKQVEADSAEAIKRRASSVSSQSSTTGGFRFLILSSDKKMGQARALLLHDTFPYHIPSSHDGMDPIDMGSTTMCHFGGKKHTSFGRKWQTG